ncbi:MAG TPA: hypothetical protein VMB82_04145, partial [Acidimicrobiales bacterium]|nr:hypothetical protein [Acidimicrobiales bacterium]
MRRAQPADAPEVVRLTGLMFASMGWDRAATGGSWDEWERNAATTLATRPPDEFAVFVVGRPEEPGPIPVAGGRLVACGAGTIARRLPGPRLPDGRAGYVQWMSTEPGYQRRGYGRA